MRRLAVSLAVEHFHMLPDAFLAMVDRTAADSGRTAQHILLELLAHFTLQDQDRDARAARARQQAYLNGQR